MSKATTIDEVDNVKNSGESQSDPSKPADSPVSALKLVSVFIVLIIITVAATMGLSRYLSVSMDADNPLNAGSQSLDALKEVESHVGVYLKKHGGMPQHIGLAQLGVDLSVLKSMPHINSVRIGGSGLDKAVTTVTARIRSDIDSPTAGHSVSIEFEVLLTTDGKPTGKIMSSCYVRGPNNQEPKIDLMAFPRECRRTRPKP